MNRGKEFHHSIQWKLLGQTNVSYYIQKPVTALFLCRNRAPTCTFMCVGDLILPNTSTTYARFYVTLCSIAKSLKKPFLYDFSVNATVVVELISDSVSELEPFSLSCVAINHPTPQVSWLKDNALLLAEELIRVSVYTLTMTDYHVVSTLTVDRAEPGIDDGIYQCRIENALSSNSVVYDSITITVEGKSYSTCIPFTWVRASYTCIPIYFSVAYHPLSREVVSHNHVKIAT